VATRRRAPEARAPFCQMADAGDAAVGRDGREEGGSVAVDTTPCPAHTPAGSLNHPSDSDPAVDEGEIVRLLQAQEAAVRREIDELKALIQSQALATKAALSEVCTTASHPPLTRTQTRCRSAALPHGHPVFYLAMLSPLMGMSS
jgi:hypothetical protein